VSETAAFDHDADDAGERIGLREHAGEGGEESAAGADELPEGRDQGAVERKLAAQPVQQREEGDGGREVGERAAEEEDQPPAQRDGAELFFLFDLRQDETAERKRA
jgi:hypothetical protein